MRPPRPGAEVEINEALEGPRADLDQGKLIARYVSGFPCFLSLPQNQRPRKSGMCVKQRFPAVHHSGNLRSRQATTSFASADGGPKRGERKGHIERGNELGGLRASLPIGASGIDHEPGMPEPVPHGSAAGWLCPHDPDGPADSVLKSPYASGRVKITRGPAESDRDAGTGAGWNDILNDPFQIAGRSRSSGSRLVPGPGFRGTFT